MHNQNPRIQLAANVIKGKIAEEIATTKPKSLEAFMKQTYSKDSSVTVDELRALTIQTIGENIQIARVSALDKQQENSIAVYSHMGGKILTLVELSGKNEEALAKDIAMHVAACSPDYLKEDEVPEDIIRQEKEIAREQVQGKPDSIIDKIITGKLARFFERHCLIKQAFVKDGSMSIEELINEQSKKSGQPISLLRFMRWSIGQA